MEEGLDFPADSAQPGEDKAVVAPVVNISFSKRRFVVVVVFLLLVGAAFLTWRLHWYQPLLNKYNSASVTLKVREGDTFALEAAKVQVNGVTYTTDHNGKVAIPQIVAGTYMVKVDKDGYQETTQSLTLHRGDNDLQFIALAKLPEKTYIVKGFAHDYVNDQPLVDVQVTLGNKTVQTDPSGAYHFENVAPGALKLAFSKAGYADKTVEQKLVDSDLVTPILPMVPNGQVIFVSNRDGRRALYSTNYDSSNQRLFVTPVDKTEDFSPVLSPTNRNVAFLSTRDKVKDNFGNDLVKLYVVGQGGKDVKNVSNDVATSIKPLWSPDGQHLYYSAYAAADLAQSTHKVYNILTGQVIDLGEDANGVVFSPNSQLVAYYVLGSQDRPVPPGSPDGTPTKVNVNIVKTLNVLTGERKVISTREQYVSALGFSEDSQSVSYEVIVESVRKRYQDSLLVPGQESEVALQPFSSRHYVSSPDQQVQVFIEERDGKKDLYSVDKTGANEKRLTTLGVLNDQFTPLFDDSSHYVTFAVKREAENALYIVGLGGGEPKKVSDYYVDQHSN